MEQDEMTSKKRRRESGKEPARRQFSPYSNLNTIPMRANGRGILSVEREGGGEGNLGGRGGGKEPGGPFNMQNCEFSQKGSKK